MAHLTDQEIAAQADIKPIEGIAEKAGIPHDALEMYGKYKAKVDIHKIEGNEKQSKVVLVSAMNPTPAGEGKSTCTVGLADAFNQLEKNVMVALREPSLGPVMGIKGKSSSISSIHRQPYPSRQQAEHRCRKKIVSRKSLLTSSSVTPMTENRLQSDSLKWKVRLHFSSRKQSSRTLSRRWKALQRSSMVDHSRTLHTDVTPCSNNPRTQDEAKAGAGFVVALTGDIMTMPGLPKVPLQFIIVIINEPFDCHTPSVTFGL